jgi:TonB family protein
MKRSEDKAMLNGFFLIASSSPAASIVTKATVTTGLGLGGAWLLRKSSAAVRHALLAAVFGVLLALPFASMFLPPLRIAVEERSVPAAMNAGVTLPVQSAGPMPEGRPKAPRSDGFTLPVLLFTGWIAGMGLFLIPVAMGLWKVRSLRQSAVPWRLGQPVVDRLASEAGMRRHVELLLHEALPGPMTCGVLHPAIVMPQDAKTWNAEDLNRAMVHELEHVRRGDWLTGCLARALCAVYWFHPLVWIAWRQLSLDAERACDDAVLARSEATAYADQLVGLARRLATGSKPPLLAMANRADLATRVSAVLDGRRKRGRAGKGRVALACCAAASLVLMIAPLKMVAAPQAGGVAVAEASVVYANVRYVSDTNLVITDVGVADGAGKPIEGLRPGDFEVTEDGRRQVLSVFEPVKLDSLPSYYILGYYTSNLNRDGNYRNVQITNKLYPTAKLTYRAGYYGPLPATAVAGGVTPGAGVTPPVPIYRPEPQYSEEARKAKWSGTVLLDAVVDASGNVTSVRVNRSAGLGLDEKAIEAATKWKFSPARKGSQAVAATVQLALSFQLL